MPFLHLTLSTPASPELTTQVATVLTVLTAQVLRKEPRLIAVALDYVNPAHWLMGFFFQTGGCTR